MQFFNKVCIITGAASGIGRACALSLSKKGAIVVNVDLNEVGLADTSHEINKNGGEYVSITADITKKKDVDKIKNLAIKKYRKIDILINCAGVCEIINIEDISEKKWDNMMEINLKGTFLMCQTALKNMKINRSGKIVNLGSVAGEVGGIFVGANYAASKAGVICLTKSLAKSAAPYNVNVNSVSPGYINTEMTKDFHHDSKIVPLRRIGTPQEVADVILFLCSDGARYITGANIDVNGGIYMG